MSFRLTKVSRKSKYEDVYVRKPLKYSDFMIRKQKYRLTPCGICIHESGTKWDAESEMKYMYGPASTTSFHVLIDSKEVIECGNMNLSTMHVNDCDDSYPNLNLISILICESNEYSNNYLTAINNAIEYVSELCREYGWDASNIFSHNDFNKKKSCPNLLLNKENPMNWEWFLNTVNGYIIRKRKEDKKETHDQNQIDEVRVLPSSRNFGKEVSQCVKSHYEIPFYCIGQEKFSIEEYRKISENVKYFDKDFTNIISEKIPVMKKLNELRIKKLTEHFITLVEQDQSSLRKDWFSESKNIIDITTDLIKDKYVGFCINNKGNLNDSGAKIIINIIDSELKDIDVKLSSHLKYDVVKSYNEPSD